MPVRKVIHRGVEIIYIDHTNAREDEMIRNLDEAEKMILREQKMHLQLINGTGSFATPKFMQRANTFGNNTKALMTKGAYVGLSGAKRILFAAYNKLVGTKLKAFETEQEALDYLAQK